MTKNDNFLKIKEILGKYSILIYDFNREIGDLRGTPKRISDITGFLIVYGKLTQMQIRRLSGYSLGAISNTLSWLVNANIVIKALIPRTHEFEYSLKNEILDTNRNNLGALQITLSHILNLLKKVDNELMELKDSRYYGYNLIKQQISFIISDFTDYNTFISYLLKRFNGSKSMIRFKSNSSRKFLDFELDHPFNFKIDQELKEVEKKIVEILQENLLTPIKGPSKTLILPYFFTRGILTQKKIKELTGLSTGAISQGLQELLSDEIIEISLQEFDDKGKKMSRKYRINSLSFAAFHRIYRIFSRIVCWEQRFKEAKSFLENEADSLKDSIYYLNIKGFIDNVIEIMPLYQEFVDKLDSLNQKEDL